ncbi:Gamma-aminobutyric acid type B receptor subunit 1 [Holothuria leucospilota]|uniref:Gamma-aminobutyric acid type B receptor subunit 1 n=1 Tax=Holothuria leucospilota TaxID=206669 RepID=A0A9Q1HCK8_HOLLE|nr:Gamma-aminobutyric acid type B receptor subunit 1 [Holothuria leucospilota]
MIFLSTKAYKHDFRGPEIVWLIPAWYRDKWWLKEDIKIDCTMEQMMEMIDTSLIIGVDVTAISSLTKTTAAGIVSIKTISQTPAEFLEIMKKQIQRPQYKTYTLNNYMAYAYDAVWAMGLVLNRTATVLREKNSSKRLEDFTYTDGDLYDILFQEMAATAFFGASVSVLG